MTKIRDRKWHSLCEWNADATKFTDARGAVRFLRQVGILADGSLWNPNGYDEDVVRRSVEATIAANHRIDSANAKRAAVTRARRVEEKVYQTASRIRTGWQVGVRSQCYICGKGMSDQPSINRGIGPECWERVLHHVEAMEQGLLDPAE